jgi:hypothetical protein
MYLKKSITESRDISKIVSVLEKLRTLPSTKVVEIDELELRTNTKNWVNELINVSQEEYIERDSESLLNDFTEIMKTRMREENKYALCLVLEKNLVLCHSIFGEETITPEWKTIPRMLDVDNILRYVIFSQEKGKILVYYWEREATSSFIDWLGLTRKQAFMFGGKYRLCSEIENHIIEFQLTEEEISEWMQTHPEFRKGKINFSSPITVLGISEIRNGQKRYPNVENFYQEFEAEKKGVPYYQNGYKKIKKNRLPLLIKYIDDEFFVERIDGDEKTFIINKTVESFTILFADEEIEFRPSFLDSISRKIRNNEKVNIFHAGVDFCADPFEFRNLAIFNKIITNELTNYLIKYFEETSIQDIFLNNLIEYTYFCLLSVANINNPMGVCFAEIGKKIIAEQVINGKLLKTEDKFIEYKSRDIVSGKNDQIIERLADDISKKIKGEGNYCKLYILGVEDDGKMNPILSSKFDSNRIDVLQRNLQQKFKELKINVFSVQNEEDLVLVIYISKSS